MLMLFCIHYTYIFVICSDEGIKGSRMSLGCCGWYKIEGGNGLIFGILSLEPTLTTNAPKDCCSIF